MAASLQGRWRVRVAQEEGWGKQRKGSTEGFYYAEIIS